MKSIFASILVLFIAVTTTFAQQNRTFQGTLTYEIFIDGHPLTDSLRNTVFLYKHFALEGIYTFTVVRHVEANPVRKTVTKGLQTASEQLSGFLLTNFKYRHYTKFDSTGSNPVKEQLPPANAKPGFDFFQQRKELEWNINAYQYVKDTVVNGRPCKQYQNLTSYNDDIFKRERVDVYVDPKQKPPAFTLSSALESALKGIIIQYDEFYANGETTSVKLKYYEHLSRKQIKTLKEFVALTDTK